MWPQARGTAPGSAAAVPEGELEQLMKALALYNLTVHKVGGGCTASTVLNLKCLTQPLAVVETP
jgi:hypothetical protein